MILCVLGYATEKLIIMATYADYTIKSEFIEGYYPDNFAFDTISNKFPVAFALADASGKPLNDFSQYGELHALSMNFDGEGISVEDIPTRKCELKDFRLGDQADPDSIRY